VAAFRVEPAGTDQSSMARRFTTLAGICALLVALALPAGSAAVDSRQVQKMTTVYCKAQKKKLGKKAFAKRYGKKAPMKACIKKQRRAVENAYRNAEADCHEELAEFGDEEFYLEWGSFDECVNWYADEYINPSAPGDDPFDEEEEADPLL
jgi:hypothetical protein